VVFADGAAAVLVPVVTWVWQPLAVPSQPVEAVLVLLLWLPAGAVAVPVTCPVQPASGHESWELLCVLAADPGSGVAFWPAPLFIPLTALVVAWALLATPHPEEPPVQVVLVCDAAGAPPEIPGVSLSPVVAAVQPRPPQFVDAEDCDIVTGAFVTGCAAWSAAWVAVCCACCAVVTAWVAACCCWAVAPGCAAIRAAWSAACWAWLARRAACWAAACWFTAIVSATTWPDPAVELVDAWQPLCELVQLPVELEPPGGGPRAPAPPFNEFGLSLPVAELRTDPAQLPPPPEQSSAADDADQLEAPGTVGATFAPAPGDPAGGVAGCC